MSTTIRTHNNVFTPSPSLTKEEVKDIQTGKAKLVKKLIHIGNIRLQHYSGFGKLRRITASTVKRYAYFYFYQKRG